MRVSCAAPGCVRPATARGMCQAHYNRRARGTALDRPVRPRSAAARLWVRVRWTPGCWLWTGKLLPNGYGNVSTGPKGATSSTTAHRAVYEAFVGPISEGLQLDHLCRNRRCVNPAHMEPVTAAENVRRARAAQEVTA